MKKYATMMYVYENGIMKPIILYAETISKRVLLFAVLKATPVSLIAMFVAGS